MQSMNASALASGADLQFGDRVVVIDGMAAFRPLPDGAAGEKRYVAGRFWGDTPSRLDGSADLSGTFGRFVVLVHEPARGRLTVHNDRYGMLPLFIAQHQGRLLLSLSQAGLARQGVRETLDVGVLTDVLAFNVPLANGTLYRGIRLLPGASRLAIDLASLDQKAERLWQPAAALNPGDRPLADVQDKLSDLLLEGYDLISRGSTRVGVTLSGGVDSRLLLAAGLALGRPMQAYATGVPGSRSLEYSKGMAELCQVPYHAYPLGPEFVTRFASLVEQNAALTQGVSFNSEAEARYLRDHVAPAGSVMMHGAFAELYKIGHMHNFPWDAGARAAGLDGLTANLLQRGRGRLARRAAALAAPLREAVNGALEARVRAKIDAVPAGSALSTVLQCLYFDEFLGKVSVASGLLWNDHLPTAFPFSYPPFVDLLLSVKPEDRAQFRFPRHFLARTHKGLAAYPDSNTGASIGASDTTIFLVHLRDWLRKKLFGSRLLFDHMDVPTWLDGLQP
ncbi:MAG: hypothetical protein JNJ60_06930, partial [Rhodocyclaceae bacterium]|nr:hypothetical protein [Rhodocyclaceae bacterium]